MIRFGKVTVETRGVDPNPLRYENLSTCAPGGNYIRAGSPCEL